MFSCSHSLSPDIDTHWSAGKQPNALVMIPSPKDPHFTGRESIIDLINTRFLTEQRIALTGIGGVGYVFSTFWPTQLLNIFSSCRKTQIAIEYCHRFRQDHPSWNILWVYASNKGRFEQSFRDIARKLGLSGWDDPARNTLELVSDWLDSGEPWLMVIDNADNQDLFFPPHSETGQITSAEIVTPLSKYLPQASSTGSILITSRTRDAAYSLTNSDESIIHVPFMGQADAMALLRHKMKGMSDPDDRSTDTEKAELVERLDCLPLAITQATSYIIVRKRTMTIPKYSKYLERNESILLARVPDNRRDPAYPNSVLLTWQISFNQINQDNKPAAELLSFMAVLDRQGIPRFLLQGKKEDDQEFENRLEPLIAFSFISADEDAQTFQMHRLVQMAIQSWRERDKSLDHFKQRALEVIASKFPKTRWEFRDTWDALLPHAQLVLGYTYPGRKIRLLHAKILHKTAIYLGVYAIYGLAIARCKSAFEIYLDLLGEEDTRTAKSLVELGLLERQLAQSTSRTVLPRSDSHKDMLLRMVGNLHEGTALERVRLELAKSLLYSEDDEDLDEAIETLESRIDSRRNSEGIISPLTNASMTVLAEAYRKRGRISEAVDMRQKVLNARLQKHGENDSRTSLGLNHMARLMLENNKIEEAYELSIRGSDSRVTTFGDEHPKTLEAMHILAKTLTRWALQGDRKHQDAYEHCRRTLFLLKKVLGDKNEKTLQCARCLARVLEVQKRYDETEDLRRQLLGLRITVHGPEDWRTKREIMELALLLCNQGKFDKARKTLREIFDTHLAKWSSARKIKLLTRFAERLKDSGRGEEFEKFERLIVTMGLDLFSEAPSRRNSSATLNTLLSDEEEDILNERPSSCPPTL